MTRAKKIPINHFGIRGLGQSIYNLRVVTVKIQFLADKLIIFRDL